jgi:hypothetical protein
MESNLFPSLKSAHQDYLKLIEQYQADFLEKKERLDLVITEKTLNLEKEMKSILKVFFYIVLFYFKTKISFI